MKKTTAIVVALAILILAMLLAAGCGAVMQVHQTVEAAEDRIWKAYGQAVHRYCETYTEQRRAEVRAKADAASAPHRSRGVDCVEHTGGTDAEPGPVQTPSPTL